MKRAMRWPIILPAITVLSPLMLLANEGSDADGSKGDEVDAKMQSFHDRGCILLKRNFLALVFPASESVGF